MKLSSILGLCALCACEGAESAASPAAAPVTASAALDPAKKEPTVTGVAEVEGFYRWYLRRVAQGSDFPNRPGDAESLARFLTPEFKAGYRLRAEQTDADPFLCAQDSFDEWVDAVQARPVKTEGDTASLLVSFGPPPSPPHKVLVKIKRQGGQWLIDSAELHETS